MNYSHTDEGNRPSLNTKDPAPVKSPDPQWILDLVDLIFLGQEEGRTVPS